MISASLADYFSKIKSLSDRVMQLRHEMIWILTGQFLGLAGGFVNIKVLTNIMGPEGYGQLALGLTIAGIYNLFVYGPVANVVARFFAVYRERGDLGAYFSVLKKSHRGLAIGLSVLSLAAGGFTGILAGREWAAIVFLSLLFGIVSGVNASYLTLMNAIRQRKVVALHQGGDVWLRLGMSVALLFLFRNSSQYALLGYLSGTLFVTVSQSMFARKNEEIRRHWNEMPSDPRHEKDCAREYLGYATPFVVFAGFGAISMYADRWIIQGLYGEGDVGIYSAIYSIANAPITLLFAIINQMMVPIIFEKAGDMTTMSQAESSSNLLRVTVMLSCAIVFPITCVAYFFGEPLVRITTNETFATYHQVLWISIMGLSIYNVGQLIGLKGLFFNRPNIYLWPKVLHASSFLLSAYLLGKHFSIMGVALALCFSALIHLFSVIYVNNRMNHMHLAQNSH
jgi:O-antigen/teichoic acid export membrane protein